MDQFGLIDFLGQAAADQTPEHRKDSSKLRPLVLPSISSRHTTPAGMVRLHLPLAQSASSRSSERRAVTLGQRSYRPPHHGSNSETSSSDDDESEEQPATHHEVAFDCISPQEHGSSTMASPSEYATESLPRGVRRTRSETFRFPMPPSEGAHDRRVPSAGRRLGRFRVPESTRTASFRADAEAFINRASPRLPAWSCTFSPMQWPANLTFQGSQGWSPDSSRAGSPVPILDAHVMEKVDSKLPSDGLPPVQRQDDMVCSPVSSSDRSEHSLLPSYQQASQLPAYKDQKSSPPSIDAITGDFSDSDPDFDADALKLARLHASYHLLDQGSELTLSTAMTHTTASMDHVLGASVEEQMAFLCGLGYRYRRPSALVMPAVGDQEIESDYDGERAEIGSSWSSSHDSEETRVASSPLPRRQRPAVLSFSTEAERRLASNTTSARSSPILSGALSARADECSVLDVDLLSDDGDESMPSTPQDAVSPLDHDSIDPRHLSDRPLPLKSLSPPLRDTKASPQMLREFSYLMDDSIAWGTPSDADTPNLESSIGPGSPFDPPLCTPELALGGMLDPMEALPSPQPVGIHPIAKCAAAELLTKEQKEVEEPSPPPSHYVRSRTCPAGLAQQTMRGIEPEGSSTFAMVPDFHRPFNRSRLRPTDVGPFAARTSTTLQPSEAGPLPASASSTTLAARTSAPTKLALSASASTSVLSRPRPLGRQTASSFFAAADLSSTEISLAKARRSASKQIRVPMRGSSLDSKEEVGSSQSEACSYFSSNSEEEEEDDDDGGDDDANFPGNASGAVERNREPSVKAREGLSHLLKKSASMPDSHLDSTMAEKPRSSVRRDSASRELPASDLSRAHEMSLRHKDLLVASSLAANAARTRRKHRGEDTFLASASASGSEESEPERQGTYYLPSSTSSRSMSLPTLFVARTDRQRRLGVTGVAETEPTRIEEVERYVQARKARRGGTVARPAKLKSRSSRVKALFGGAMGKNATSERSVVRLNTPRAGVLIVEEKMVEVV